MLISRKYEMKKDTKQANTLLVVEDLSLGKNKNL